MWGQLNLIDVRPILHIMEYLAFLALYASLAQLIVIL